MRQVERMPYAHEFPRPVWHLGLHAYLIGPMVGGAIAGAPWLTPLWVGLAIGVTRAIVRRVVVDASSGALMLDVWPRDRRRAPVPLATAVEIRRRAPRVLVVRLASGAEHPLVVGRRATAADLDGARYLAARLGVPFVDDVALGRELPAARVVVR